MFTKILIANRGEIACRVIRTAKKLGIRTVAVFSDADTNALHVQLADEAVHIGGSAPKDSYLVMENVIAAAKQTGAQAIHPGYGFLSENATFCELCAANDIVFIGPPVGAIQSMGSKSAAKEIMSQADVPLLPGYHGADQTPQLLQDEAQKIGYPVLLKAVSGGGGKGMRQVYSDAEFEAALSAAQREAQAGFGDDAMLVEKYLQEPRHVEVQVFCDSHGNGVYLFERDCSVQRRHQKIIEEAPAPNLPAGVREQMGEAALRAARAVDYVGAGTVEFLLDASGHFYFMEMNTRLQVEHPVTEMITHQDLVEWQLKVANGESLPCSQSDLAVHGHAFEARIYAEDPDNEFLPAAGSLAWLQEPEPNQNVRIDTGVIQGDEVGVFYDPMIAKLIVWGEDRNEALARLDRALATYRIVGVTTNIKFLRQLAQHPAFGEAKLSTDFIQRHTTDLFAQDNPSLDLLAPLACLYLILNEQNMQTTGIDINSPWNAKDSWRANASARVSKEIMVEEDVLKVEATLLSNNTFQLEFSDNTSTVSASLERSVMDVTVNGHRRLVQVIDDPSLHEISLFTDDQTLTFSEVLPDLGEDTAAQGNAGFKAPMNGTVVDILVSSGDQVAAGDLLMIMEAMKMEHAIKAPADGQVTEIFFAKGDLVDGGADLLNFEAESSS